MFKTSNYEHLKKLYEDKTDEQLINQIYNFMTDSMMFIDAEVFVVDTQIDLNNRIKIICDILKEREKTNGMTIALK